MTWDFVDQEMRIVGRNCELILLVTRCLHLDYIDIVLIDVRLNDADTVCIKVGQLLLPDSFWFGEVSS